MRQKTLGPVSATLISELINHGKTTFNIEDACKFYKNDKQATAHLLRDLVNRGILARIKSGNFLILHTGQEATQLSNWPVIVRILTNTNSYYISYYSAMRLHGMTTHPLFEVTISMTKRRTSKKINNLFYRFIYCKPNHFWGKCEHWITKHEKVVVSDLERTILDGLDRPDLSGGLQEVVRGIWNQQQKINWTRLVEYAKRFHNRAAVKRLGFILEMFNLKSKSIPILLDIITPGKDYVLLDPTQLKQGQYLSRWKLQLNINVDELKTGIWG